MLPLVDIHHLLLFSGCPTVVCPFIFDQVRRRRQWGPLAGEVLSRRTKKITCASVPLQEYFGGLVQDNNCGKVVSPAKDLTVAELAEAISEVPPSDPALLRHCLDPLFFFSVGAAAKKKIT